MKKEKLHRKHPRELGGGREGGREERERKGGREGGRKGGRKGEGERGRDPLPYIKYSKSQPIRAQGWSSRCAAPQELHVRG